MNLGELLRDTEALTYINALKVTLTELKEEISQVEELTSYMTQHMEKVKKLQRKADNHYRLIAKLAQNTGTIAHAIAVVDDIEDTEEVEELMKNE